MCVVKRFKNSVAIYCGFYNSFYQCGQSQFLEMTEKWMNVERYMLCYFIGKPGSNPSCPK